MSLLAGSAWYRTRIAKGHDDPRMYRGEVIGDLAPTADLPLDVLEGVDDRTEPTPFELALEAERADWVRRGLAACVPRWADVLRERYGLDGPERTLEEVGRKRGYTREAMRQWQRNGEAQLKAILGGRI